MSVSRDNKFYFEGGRANYDKYAARQTIRACRRKTNMRLTAIRRDPECVDELAPMPRISDEIQRYWCSESRTNMYSITDRWLARQVGRCWDDVYSELCQRLGDFRRSGWFRSYIGWKVCTSLTAAEPHWFDYFVDESGIMRERDEYDGPRFNYSARPIIDPDEFLADRLVARFCGELVWLVPTRWAWRYERDCATDEYVTVRYPLEYDLGDELTPEEEDAFWIVRDRIKVWTKKDGRRFGGKYVINGQPMLERMLAA